jgi:uncharacterized membrane protein
LTKTRLEAFCDAVIAIILTIMVLELKVPHGTTLAALKPVLPVFLVYTMSFVYLGIYWSNHHHFYHTVKRVNGAVLWANLHLLFWLSLVPFTTAWMGENHLAPVPTAVYGLDLLLAAIAWYIMQTVLIKSEGRDSRLARAIGRDLKGKISPFLYLAAIVFAFVQTWVSIGLYVIVTMMWLVPDRRVESVT